VAEQKTRPIDYGKFLDGKSQLSGEYGFEPDYMPDFLFDFQAALVEWSTRKGRAAIFADCGLGKTPMQLVWAENVVRKTNKPVLILAPLAVSPQTVGEGEKFGIDCVRSQDGKIPNGARIIVTNYERLHYFDPSRFSGCVCDESSILKNFDGATRAAITEFMRTLPYRLLCTATAAPNDYIELGTSSEALGELGFMDVLNRFFKKIGSATCRAGEYRSGMWRFRGHSERDFWRWVCSWVRAVRKPSDLGFDNGSFVLPELRTREHVVKASRPRAGFMFDMPAITLHEQREERRRTLPERCQLTAELVSDTGQPAICWCHLNDEGDTLERLIPGAVQVAGKDSDDRKEEVFGAFRGGQIRVIVTKPTIAGFGLNWQHCAHQTFFPSHSYEQWYQAVRRSWRFGQTRPVTVDVIASEGERGVLSNMQRKDDAASEMFAHLVELMGRELRLVKDTSPGQKERVPQWL